MAWRATRFTITYYAFLGLVWYVTDFIFLFHFLIVPLILSNTIFATINWTWHCFVPENQDKFLTNTVLIDAKSELWGENNHVEPIKTWQDADDRWEHIHLPKAKETNIIHTNIFILFMLTITRQYWLIERWSNMKQERIIELLRYVPPMEEKWKPWYKYF